MNDEARRNYEKELTEDAERIMEEISGNSDLQNIIAPPKMYENIRNAIRAKEEETELIRLGRIYEKKRKNRKYLALVAVMVLAMAFGITSFGGAEKIFEKVTWMMAGREQSNVDSDDTKPMEFVDEEAVYEEIENKYGFVPVKLEYLPDGVEFQKATIGDEAPWINIVYGQYDETNIIYWIRPNYRNSSWGKDVEDELIKEYEVEIDDTLISMKKYLIENGAIRWLVGFEYRDVSYSMYIMDMEKEEVEKIIENLYFF